MSVIFPQVELLLRLLEVRTSPNPPPRWHNTYLFCSFHRASGHSTNDYVTLRDAVQGLIDRKVISVAMQEVVPTSHLHTHMHQHSHNLV